MTNVIERALMLCDEGVVHPEHLPMGVRRAPAPEREPGERGWLSLEQVELSGAEQLALR